MLRMSNGEGQSSCRKCRNRDWDSMMYKVDCHEGVYCWKCAVEIARSERQVDWNEFMMIWLFDYAKRGELYYRYIDSATTDLEKCKIKINPIDIARNKRVFNLLYSTSKDPTVKIFYYISIIADVYTYIYGQGEYDENTN